MILLKRDQEDFIQDHPSRNGNGSNEIFCRGERDGVTPNAAGARGNIRPRWSGWEGTGRKSLGGKVRWRESVLR